jgi:hypothetical protein
MRTKDLLLIFTTSLFCSIFLIAGSEYVLRVREGKELRKKIERYVHRRGVQFDKYKEIYSDERNKKYKFGHKPNINVKLTKGLYEFSFITNSEGLREKEEYGYIEKSVIFLGDSVVEGASVENNETMDSVFEQETGLTALNFGVSSRGVFLAYHYLKSKYKKNYNTKLIIYGFCLNDFYQNYVSVFDSNLGTWRLLRPLSLHYDTERGIAYNLSQNQVIGKFAEFLYEIFLGLRSRIFIQKKIFKNNEKQPEHQWCSSSVNREQELFIEFYLKKIKEFASSIKSEFIVAIFPMKQQFKQGYCQGELLQYRLKKILKENNISFIDLYDTMKYATKKKPNVRMFHDNAHPYKKGHHLIGITLSEEISKRYPNLIN